MSMTRRGQFFIITAVLIAGALITITTILTASETIDYNAVLERHDTGIIDNVGDVIEEEWWDQDWNYRKQVIVREEAGAFLTDEAVTVYLDARNGRVNDSCADVRPVVDGQAVAWVNTTGCDVDTYASDSDAVSRWKLDDGSGSTADDAAGSNDGTLNGGPQWVSGRFGSGLRFDGSGDHVETGTNGFASATFTAMLWARGPGTSQSSTRIINYGDETANNGGFIIGEDDNGRVRAYVMDDSGSWTSFHSGTGLIADGDWHHLAITYDGSNATLYVDGEEENTVATTYDETPPNPTFKVGRAAHDSEDWEGTVDDVRVYDTALSRGQIDGIHHDGIGLNISLTMAPNERLSDIAIYYDRFGVPDPGWTAADLNVTALSQRPTVVQVGPFRSQDETVQKMARYVDTLNDDIGPTLTYDIRENQCDILTLRSIQAVLDREVC